MITAGHKRNTGHVVVMACSKHEIFQIKTVHPHTPYTKEYTYRPQKIHLQ